MLLDLGDSSAEQLTEGWRGPIRTSHRYNLLEFDWKWGWEQLGLWVSMKK